MDLLDDMLRIQAAYPRIYHWCHRGQHHSQAPAQTLTQRDAAILAHLDTARPVAQADLARHLGIAKSTMSEALRHLVAAGFVAQQEQARAHLLVLTAQGRAAMGAHSVLEAAPLAQLLGALSAEERALAVRGLELLADAGWRLTQQTKETP
ncbi:MarR family winged helix-turn-helix transcriptional regulator [Massilia sp. TS11]|uniref:MarR family winged helix-turn-helix transcriptional regulator n=1 Tax=Massilia sp. TS11 TaxID=2908003 RepID=UPI001EDC69CA|nr:MarR family winged helix-turn-helix transcriptional regulator [Massilia sp. TS11]MCG2584396.1 MarR family winged helix-turn-helix transcriptional regulator [Massilia sp. TS11]